MNEVNIIRETIQLAKAHEAETGHLSKLLQSKLPQLHNSIKLPDTHPEQALVQFVTLYIEHVPNFIEAISHLTQDANVFDYAEIFLRIAKDFFLKPPEIITGRIGLDALMDEAYLAHRLMEEVNDRFLAHSGSPLAPMDMTRANLIIHHLIGESFANKLDEAVQFFVESSMRKEQIFNQAPFQDYLQNHRKSGWQSELEQWPCLAEDLDIVLHFKTSEHKKHLH